MDNKDGRRSRVPAGTFGGSDPPPTSDEATQPGGSGEEPTRPGLRRAISAQPPPVPRDAAADESDDERERRKRYVSTLVGHPMGTSAPAPPPPPPGAMLAPPRWTGAGPYLEGQDPQPRVSALPAPQHVPVPPVAAAEPSRSRITTKVGHALVPQQPSPPAAPHDTTSRLPAIGDAIQQMLDSQSSVSMQVEEQRAAADVDDDIPIEDLQIEEILDSLSEAEEVAIPEPRFSSRGDEATLQHAAPPPPDAPEPARALRTAEFEADTLRPPTQRGIDLTAAEAKSPRAAEPGPAVPPEEPRAPEAPQESARPRRIAVESDLSAAANGAGASSLAPSEVKRRPRYRDDSQAGVGVLLLAAMAVIGVGGWFLTRGTYPRERRALVIAEVGLATPEKPAAVAKPADKAPAPHAVAAPPTPAVAPPATTAPVEPAAPAPDDAPGKRVAPSRRRSSEKPDDGPTARSPGRSTSDDDEEDEEPAKMAPRPASAALPDKPSRDDVLSALAPIRPAVAACAHGQRGIAQLDITVADTGAVTHAVVGGDFAGTSEGSCIARTVRSAQFAPFKQPRFRVIYPFAL